MNRNTCCFSGHRTLPLNKTQAIVANLNREIDALIENGVTNFISGGALGFDQIAASLIVSKKEMGRNIKLILALPCKNQDAQWNKNQQKLYRDLLGKADEIIYVSEEYDSFCMKRRNNYMVEHSAYCICALLHQKSGTGQTVRFAGKKGLKIINVAG